MTYSDKLKDPRWQKVRLKIMERDSFGCQFCGDKKSQLQVHHLIYRKNADPWEYEHDELKTLCCNCHKSVTEVRKQVLERLDEVWNVAAFAHLCRSIDQGKSKKATECLITLNKAKEGR